MNLYIQIINAIRYIDDCYVLEQSENQNIIIYISEWLKLLKRDLENDIIEIFQYYEHSDLVNDEIMNKEINLKCDNFYTIIKNFDYIPLQSPFFTLRTMIEEAEDKSIIPDQSKISRVYFKNISQFNFTENRMKEPEYYRDRPVNRIERIREKVGGSIPHVLSMAVIYHYNPLMWPLLFHEYGHLVFIKNLEKTPIQSCITNIINKNNDSKKPIDENLLKESINEVYSDIFAINCYSTNYFFAFYFHQMIEPGNLEKTEDFEYNSPHPPSIIRIEYMRKELEKCGYLKDNPALEAVLNYHDAYVAKHAEKIGRIYGPYKEIFDAIYNSISLLFDKKPRHEFKKEHIEDLTNLLDKETPIGTFPQNAKNLRQIMQKPMKKFDIDANNEIIDIIYTGWNYLILKLFSKLYLDQPEYPISSKPNERSFYNDYAFLIKNINYSIETAVIVSSYLGGNGNSRISEFEGCTTEINSEEKLQIVPNLLGRKDIISLLLTDVPDDRIIVTPILSSYQIQPASLDVRLGTEFLIIKTGKITYLNPLDDPRSVKFQVEKYTDKYKILSKNDCFILHPNEFILGCTLEYIKLPKNIAARIEGRSSWGRLGIAIHATAGFIDPGFSGNITFELKNMGKTPIPLYPGIKMAQLSFFKVFNDPEDPGYQGKYYKSFGVVSSKYFEDCEYNVIRKSRESTEDFFTDFIQAIKAGDPIPKKKEWDLLPQQLRKDIESAYDNIRDKDDEDE